LIKLPKIRNLHQQNIFPLEIPEKLNLKKCLSAISNEKSQIKKEGMDTSVDNQINDLVVITIHPDNQGKFGFNVKGGIDQNSPIIVSRVGANTPAEM